jgi:hypothetical protein
VPELSSISREEILEEFSYTLRSLSIYRHGNEFAGEPDGPMA